MLRYIFVFAIIALGVAYATQGPFYVLLFYLWNAYFRPESWVWDSTPIRVLNLSFVIGLYLVISAAFAARAVRLNLRTGLMMVFLLQTTVSTLTSEHADWSWTYWIEFVKAWLVSYLIVVLVTDRRRLRLTLLVIALSLGFECAKQGWAQLILNPGAQNTNIIVFLGDNNGVALGTMMLVPVFGALAQTATRRWEAHLHRVFAVGVFMRGITTYSRGGFIAAGALGLLSFIRSPRKIRALISVAAVALVVTIVMPPQFWDRMQTIVAPSEERDYSQRGRLHFWQIAFAMGQTKPLTGVGFNGYEVSYEAYNRDPEFDGLRAAHSVWLGLLADLGYPGLLLFAAIWCLAVWSCLRVSALGRGDPSIRDLRAYANALLTSLLVFAVGGTFLSAQYSEMFWHFIGLSTALQLVATSEVGAAEPVVSAPFEPRPALASS